MKEIIFTLILVLSLGFSASAQSEISPCPTIDVSGGGIVQLNEPMSFTVDVSEDAKNLNLEYNWTVSKGTITAGQGTRTIMVDKTGFPINSVTATVEIKGLPKNCPNISSETMLYCPPPSPLLLDEFANLSNTKQTAKIEEMYLKLENEPSLQGYIINYGTDKEIALRERQIQKAIAFLKYDSSRVTIVRGGENPNGAGVWTRIWIIPPGAEFPIP